MKIVILDRDGVINHDSDAYIKTAREWVPVEGSLEAIARLTHADYRVMIATNQSAIGRRLIDYADLFSINEKMIRIINELGGRIDGVFFCPHTPDDDCSCRKPMPGLLQQITQRLGVGLEGVPMIGDSLKDLQAAQAVGARPILVRTGKGLKTEADLPPALANTQILDDLAAAVSGLLAASG